MDPAEFLPYEIFEAIVRFAAAGHASGPLPFLTVSTRWQNTIVEIPDAWTFIVINDDEDAPQRTEAFLHLSYPCPLKIQIDQDLQSLQSVQPLLRPEVASRMKSLHFWDKDLPIHFRTIPPQFIFEYLEKGGTTYPLLEELTSTRDLYPSGKFLGACTNLRWTTGILISSNILTFLSQEARSIGCLLDRLGDLEQLRPRKLTSLTLHTTHNSGLMEDQTVFPRLLKASAQQLENLTLEGDCPRHFLSSLFLHPLTRLHTLSVVLPVNAMEFFASSLPLLPQLVTLTLYLTHPSDEMEWPTVPAEAHTGGPRLKKLTVMDYPSSAASTSALPDFTTAFTGRLFLTTIEHLSISLGYYHHNISFLLPMLEKISSLRILELQDNFRAYRMPPKSFDVPTDRSVNITVKTLEILKVFYGPPIGFVHTPNLQTLEFADNGRELTTPPKGVAFATSLWKMSVTSATFEVMNTESSDDINNLNSIGDANGSIPRWTNLSEITWKNWNNRCGTYTASLPSLTTVSLSCPGRPEQIPINTLCLALLEARSGGKDACPFLRTINSHSYPCWSLLSAVLKQRLDNPNVRPITTIGLPALPIPPILRPLVDLLGGRGKDMYEKREGRPRKAYKVKDIDSLIQRRLDKYAPLIQPLSPVSSNQRLACFNCLLSGYVRCIDDENVNDLTIASISDLLELPYSPYSSDLTETFESYVSQELSSFHQHSFSETNVPAVSTKSCRRHDYKNYVNINAFTSVGEYVHLFDDMDRLAKTDEEI